METLWRGPDNCNRRGAAGGACDISMHHLQGTHAGSALLIGGKIPNLRAVEEC